MKKAESKQATVKEKVLSHLQKGNKLTGLQALKKFDTIRLAVYIHRLRMQGIDIKGEDIETPSGKTITRYYINNAR